MFCGKCGNELPDGAKFCGRCGAVIGGAETGAGTVSGGAETSAGAEIGGAVIGGAGTGGTVIISGAETGAGTQSGSNLGTVGTQQDTAYLNQSSYNQIFVEPDEKLLATLGNGWATNLLFHNLKKCNALLTDKRLYFQGTFFSGSGKSLTSQRAEKVIDLEDITGTGFVYSKGVGALMILIDLLILAALSAIGILIGGWVISSRGDINDTAVACGIVGFVLGVIVDIVSILLSRKTHFAIEYAGGGISFNAKIVGIADVRYFQKQIRRAKDKVKGKI